MSQTANRVIKNTGYLYAKMAITMFVSLYTTRLILNSLGASDFGIYNIVGGVISMLGFLNAAMAASTQRFMNFAEGEGNNEKKVVIFNVSIVLHVLVAAIVGVMLLIAGVLFFNGILNIPDARIFAAKIVYASLIISTMVTILTVPYDAVLNSHENMKYYSIVGVFESLLKLTVAFACVYTSEDKLLVYGLLMAAIPFVSLFIMAIYCHKRYSECCYRIRINWDKEIAKDIARDLEGADIAGFNSNRFDVPVLVEEFLRAGIDIDLTKRKFIDVQVIYHKLEQRTLSAAYKFYCGKNLEDAHTAEADTRATYEVLKAQLDHYPDVLENDIKFLSEYSTYSKNVDFAGRIVFDDNGVEVFNFGKYKGISVAEVLQRDPGYYGWILNGDFTLNTKNVLTKIRLRESGLVK